MWQIVCIIDTLRVDVAYKIILKKYNEQKKKKCHHKNKTKLIPQLNPKKEKTSV